MSIAPLAILLSSFENFHSRKVFRPALPARKNFPRGKFPVSGARKRKTVGEQFDLFLPYIADLNFRDQREMMERPFFSLAKTKRMKPIDYNSPDGKLWVHVSANPDYGMATIWDADILIYCASMLADMARRGQNDIPRTLNIMPYDLLRAIGRPTTGRAYELLGQALDRLVSTTIKTNIRAENRREATFSWLDGWTQLVDEKTERSRGMTLEISNWFWEGVLMKGGVLSIDRAYFDISGGRERWLYKVARKHAGGMGEGGFAISMPTLFEKSGAEGSISPVQVRDTETGGEERAAWLRSDNRGMRARRAESADAQTRRSQGRKTVQAGGGLGRLAKNFPRRKFQLRRAFRRQRLPLTPRRFARRNPRRKNPWSMRASSSARR